MGLNLYIEAITVIRPGESTDRYGTPQLDWDAATSTAVVGVNVQSSASGDRATSEEVIDRQSTTSDYLLITPRGMDIDLQAADRVGWGALTLEVVGEVARWTAPGGGLHHVEARLRRITG